MVNRTIEDVLFENSTSRNAKDEFLNMFFKLFPTHETGCSFYQGCGEDICTILVPNIDVHVFSDTNSKCFERIKEKLRVLAEMGFISELNHPKQNESRFTYHGHAKVLRYTQRAISEIDFIEAYGGLKLIFEFNPGDSAHYRSFWNAVALHLAPGGYLLGSYVDSPELLDREAWCISHQDQQEEIWIFHNNLDKKTEIRLNNFVQNEGIKSSLLEKHMINFENTKYLVTCLNPTRNLYIFQRTESIPISTFNLILVEKGSRMCLLQKHNKKAP